MSIRWMESLLEMALGGSRRHHRICHRLARLCDDYQPQATIMAAGGDGEHIGGFLPVYMSAAYAAHAPT